MSLKPFENVNAKLLAAATECEDAGLRDAAAVMRRATNEIDRLRGIVGDRSIALVLDHNEAQAILNGLREGGALNGPLVFDHVMRLKNKVESAMRAAGFPPLNT